MTYYLTFRIRFFLQITTPIFLEHSITLSKQSFPFDFSVQLCSFEFTGTKQLSTARSSSTGSMAQEAERTPKRPCTFSTPGVSFATKATTLLVWKAAAEFCKYTAVVCSKASDVTHRTLYCNDANNNYCNYPWHQMQRCGVSPRSQLGFRPAAAKVLCKWHRERGREDSEPEVQIGTCGGWLWHLTGSKQSCSCKSY